MTIISVTRTKNPSVSPAMLIMNADPTKCTKGNTVQRKYFEGYKFRRFHCFPAKCENYFRENERTPIVMWLNYACDPRNLFSAKSKF